ncbi:uncharacterized protein LOC117906359 [Vitis riparia]|uniref:uncharacterized protein LOC117906359 n=1 Tax=Vitis riparia TaxID=96939 RepID=UPI00155AFB1E|nr:uncharacterized protein LOC117906359 [Vitis riparia]
MAFHRPSQIQNPNASQNVLSIPIKKPELSQTHTHFLSLSLSLSLSPSFLNVKPRPTNLATEGFSLHSAMAVKGIFFSSIFIASSEQNALGPNERWRRSTPLVIDNGYRSSSMEMQGGTQCMNEAFWWLHICFEW